MTVPVVRQETTNGAGITKVTRDAGTIAKESELTLQFNEGIRQLVSDAIHVSSGKPSLIWFFLRTMGWQKRAGRRRVAWENKGVHVPPFMIVSVTSRCNLHCKGCYSHAQHRSADGEMSETMLRNLLEQARELGISIALLAGGEPLVRGDILRVTRDFPDILFPMFTNGTLIDEAMAGQLAKQKNLIPVISLEGHEGDTDERRGAGVFEYAKRIIERIKGRSVFLGISLTVTSRNFTTITSEDYIQGLIDAGCRLVFFIEYIPVKEGTEDWCLTDEQRTRLAKTLEGFRAKFPGLFISFPGDEEESGGCLSSGRGFVHVSSDGRLEPCPFAPYSDTSLKDTTLKEALQSKFLRAIRENPEMLRETRGGCALWENREWVRKVLSETAGSPDGTASAPEEAGS